MYSGTNRVDANVNLTSRHSLSPISDDREHSDSHFYNNLSSN